MFPFSCFLKCGSLPGERVSPSGEAEIYALSEAVRATLNLKYIGEELGISVPDTPVIRCDATAALGFASNTGTVGRLKHIDLRNEWVKQLRSAETIKVKEDTKTNKADQFTKILSTPEYQKGEDELMPEVSEGPNKNPAIEDRGTDE